MQHNLVHRLWRIGRISLAPIVADRIGKDSSIPVESRRADSASDLRISFKTMLGIFVPEVECAVATGCAEGTVYWVEGDGVDGVDVGDIPCVGGVLAVALEGEVGAG